MTTLSAVLAAAALAAAPGGPTVERAPSGRWSAAFGLEPVVRGSTPEASARAFTALHADDLGLTARHELALDAAPDPGRPGVVRFQRLLDGWPVFGGGLALSVDAAGGVLAVTSAEVAPEPGGRFALTRSEAVDRAVLSLGGPGQVRLPAVLLQGWAPVGDGLRAAYQVDLDGAAGAWRVLVDAEDGRVLFQKSRRVHVQGSVYDISPVEYQDGSGAAVLCPVVGGSYDTCASAGPFLRTLADLPANATSLAGSIFSVYNCRGGNIPAAGSTAGCDQSYGALTGGNFVFTPDPYGGSATDDFASVMAYYHLTRHIEFVRGLDPSAASQARLTPSRALTALVNGYESNAPYPNAFFEAASGTPTALSGRMVFGQYYDADFAYDASIMYHELTHGVVNAWGDYNDYLDQYGAAVEADAANEGTADALAMAHTGDPRMSTYVGQTVDFGGPGALGLRVMGQRLATCTNTPGSTFAFDPTNVPKALYGLDGEPHDDGEIWGNFFWEVFDGLKGISACGGACTAGAAIQYRAIQQTAGNSVGLSLKTYADSFRAAAASLYHYPGDQAVQDFVQCAYDRHEMASCDRTLPVFAGEQAVAYVWARYAAHQFVVQTTGPATVEVCKYWVTALSAPGKVWAIQGQKVSLTNPSVSGETVAPGAAATPVSNSCGTGGVATVSLPTAGTWYLLLDFPSTYGSGVPGSGPANFVVRANGPNIAARPAAPPAPAPCVLAPRPAIAPGSPTVPPRGTLALTAAGGNGAPYAWSLTTNASGGSLTAAGLYTAGVAASVTDVVTSTDSGGAKGSTPITVGPGVSIHPSPASVQQGLAQAFTASGGSGTGYVWSLRANLSGGAIVPATGAYTAGPTAGVADVVEAVDSLGNTAGVSVAVVVAPPETHVAPSKKGCGCGSGGAPSAALALVPLLLRRRRRPPSRPRVRGP